MRRKSKITALVILLAMVVTILRPFCSVEQYQAATSYTNAKEFYESTTQADYNYHADAENGKIYYATKAKLAASSTNTKYYTVGFDITLSGNGHSVSFTVQRSGGSMAQVGNPVKSGDYEYNLYVITEDKLYQLASKADSVNASYVLSASTINVRMDAIMTTKEDGSLKGGITENGSGGFTKWGKIYRLKNSSEMKNLKEIFAGHSFESYKNIYVDLDNYLLKVRYNVLGLNPTSNAPTLSNSKYTFNSTGLLQESGATYFDESRTLKKITLLNTSATSGIGLSKTGYHLPGGNEWVTDNSRYFASNGTYQSTTIDPLAGYQNHGITMYANWKPNTYTIYYNSNGGNGTVPPSSMTYDTVSNLRANTFTRTGYYLPDGKEWIDADGNTYASGQSVKNLATSNGAQITLYANWVPCVYQITLDKQEGTGGADYFFEKYGLGFYSNAACTSSITSITVPSKLGYEFQGYFSSVRGAGEQMIGKNGLILSSIPYTYFTKDTTIFADWKAKQFTITFDKQGGAGGTDSAIATYGKLLPSADGPIRIGYTFEGYFYEDEDDAYYTAFMVPATTFLFEKDITLSAKWVDDILPTASICVSTSSWTNREGGIDVVATAFDLGEGLDRVELYCGDSLIDSKTGLNGINDVVEIKYVHKNEGAYRYRVIAYDTEGNIAEAYETCLYDITAPSGEYTVENDDVTNFKIIVDTSDYNISP